jgi:hypothetical protein
VGFFIPRRHCGLGGGCVQALLAERVVLDAAQPEDFLIFAVV